MEPKLFEDDVKRELKELNGRKDTMLGYLKMKIAEQDWHGVADAAMDLRDIEAEVIGLQKAALFAGMRSL